MQSRSLQGTAVLKPDLGPSAWSRTLRRGAILLGLTLFSALVFAVALVVTMPASVIARIIGPPPQVETVSGSLWRGRARLSGGYDLTWRWTAGELLRFSLGVSADLDGVDTQLSGRLFVSPFAVNANDVSGRAGPGLLGLVPGLPVKGCDTRAVVDISGFEIGRTSAAALGRIGIAEGTCTDTRGTAHPFPAMTVDLSTEGDDAVGVLSSEDARLAQFALSGDVRARVRVEPEGAILVPGLPMGGPIELEFLLR